LSERWFGLSAQRTLPRWRSDTFFATMPPQPPGDTPGRNGAVVLFADTFNNYFEPENALAALKVLRAAGYHVHVARPATGDSAGSRPLCCGRTYLAAGMVEQAREEADRVLNALAPFLERNLPVIGLEPSCVLGLRDEYRVMRLGDLAQT